MESSGEAAVTAFQGAEAVGWEMVEDRRHGGREKGEGKMKMSIFREIKLITKDITTSK